ncbi:MAG: GNAT family N-acetyltransferase [Thermoplasmata archaeon]|nr:GNAT family N-acetyltransferase [Thermoplasmata archaeon]
MPRRRRTAWKLRRASASEGRLLVDHRHRMWIDVGGRTSKQISAHDPVYRRWILPRVRSGEVIVIVIEAPGRRVVASGAIWFRPEQPRPGAPQLTVPYLFSMYTEPQFRGRGLASRIVRETLRICRRRGYIRVLLHAAPLGRPVYRRLGFERSWEMRLPL